MYFVYIIQSLQDNSFYIGHTSNIKKRLDRHNEGKSKYTKAKRPWELVYTEEFKTKGEAMKREMEIKKVKSRKYIEWLINNKNNKGPVV